MKLDLTSLKDTLQSFEKSIHAFYSLSKNPTVTSIELETVKAGVIQNFEVAYEQCWKFMKRWLETNISPSIADGISRRELFRLSAENRLIDSVDEWMDFHDARNLTSHTYSLAHAEQTFQASLSFIETAQNFLERLMTHND